MKIPIDKIIPDPNQPRKTFEDEHIENIKNSINRHGFVSQIVVRPHNDKYMIIVGENRWRAARKAGLKEIECTIRESVDTDAREMQFIENYHRKNIPPLELAQAIKKFREETGLSLRDLGDRIGIGFNRLKELEALCIAAIQIQDYVRENKLDSSSAFELTKVPNEKTQIELAEIVVKDELPRSKVRPMVSMALAQPDASAHDIAASVKLGILEPRKKKERKPRLDVCEIMEHLSSYLRKLEIAELNKDIAYENLIDWRQTFINMKELAERMIKFTEKESNA